MKHIATTATAINKIKAAARKLKKDQGIPLAQAQNLAAQAAGYDNYHHATTCATQTSQQQSRNAVGPGLLGQLEFRVAADEYELELHSKNGHPKGTSTKPYGSFLHKRGRQALDSTAAELDNLVEKFDVGFGNMDDIPEHGAAKAIARQMLEWWPNDNIGKRAVRLNRRKAIAGHTGFIKNSRKR